MRVQTGNNVGIGGFIVTGSTPKQVLLRAIGPSLTRFGVVDVLADPVMELHGPTGFTTIINNNWRDTEEDPIQATGIPPTNDCEDNPAQAAMITAAGLAPSNNLESAIDATLPPGLYTALLAGLNGGTGNGLLEVYDRGTGVPGPSPSPGASPSPVTSPSPG